jgi:peptidoglycan/LPS O-acetylase OafA/YrhL
VNATPRASGGDPGRGASGAEHRLPYLPALDGLRTLALLAVLLDHAGVPHVVGGHFGVTVFFVLSGFLVTALLLQERTATGRVDLRAFWGRRVRRLAPASLLFVAFTLAYLTLSGDRAPSTVLGDGLASLGWVANWRFVLTGRTYGDLFADPTPFAHVWSLAVEEQCYLVLPVVAAVALRRGRRWPFALAIAATAVASTIALWASPAATAPVRAYYGTDTRVAELALGALLALALVHHGRLRQLPNASLPWLSLAGAGGLGGVAFLVATVGPDDRATYRGGLTLVALLSAVAVAAATQPSTGLAKVLTVEPLPQLGRLTYGAYLFHWPVFLWVDHAATGLAGPSLLTLRLLITFGLALTSFVVVEQPVRVGPLRGIVGGLTWIDASIAVAAALVLVSGLGPASAPTQWASGTTGGPPPVPAPPAPASRPAVHIPPPPANAPTTIALPIRTGPSAAAPTTPKGTPAAAATGPTKPTPPPASTTTIPKTIDPNALRVAVVGDSLGHNLGHGLARWADARSDLVVYDLAIPACPISRGGQRRFPNGTDFPIDPGCDWWDDPTTERSTMLRDFAPDVVLVEDALNEIADRKLPSWPDYRSPGDPRFDGWLLNEYQAAAKVFSQDGALVVYANAPCADWQRLNGWNSMRDADARVAALNRIYDGVVAATTKVANLYERLCPDGQYRDEVEGVSDGRPDGFHLSDEAALRLADRWLAPFVRDADRSRTPL